MAQKVLVVDDEAAIRDTLRMVLEYEGYEVADGGGRPSRARRARRRPGRRRPPRHQDGRHGRPRDARPHRRPAVGSAGAHDLGSRRHRDGRRMHPPRGGGLPREAAPARARARLGAQRPLGQPAPGRERASAEARRGGDDPRRRKRAHAEAPGRGRPGRADRRRRCSSSGRAARARSSWRARFTAASKVASGPFIQVNCAAIPEELIESELFGHEKGSFTGAVRKQTGKFVEADGGHDLPRRGRRHVGARPGQGPPRPGGRRSRARGRGAGRAGSTCASSPRPTAT